MGHIIHGAYHVDFDIELQRMREALIKLGINEPNKIEISAFLAYKSKRAKIESKDVFDFFHKLRIGDLK